ncbi:MAG: septal ring lytic transglycosylase RlpA family protein [Candidatus Cloacimonetes bacterium]|nr:septal ring lytic transglycosylase RlpA family protein [Candidatus Cloacimonadota bacterium]
MACAPAQRYYTPDDEVSPRSRYYGTQQPEPVATPEPAAELTPSTHETTPPDTTLNEIWAPPHSGDFADGGAEGEIWVASYYAHKFHGRTTSNGETFDMYKMTCAHKSLAFGTLLRVTNPDNGNSVVVRVNDRGPFIPGRDIDLSLAAARAIGLVAKGVMEVRVQVIEQ